MPSTGTHLYNTCNHGNRRKITYSANLMNFHSRYNYTLTDPDLPSSLELLRIKYNVNTQPGHATDSNHGNDTQTMSNHGNTDPKPTNQQPLPDIKTSSDLKDADSLQGSQGSRSGSDRSRSQTQSMSGKMLIEAAEKGDIRTVRYVLENCQTDPDKNKRYQSRSALHLACGYGQYDVAEKLLQVILRYVLINSL